MYYNLAKCISIIFLIHLLMSNVSAGGIPEIKQSELSELTITRNETFDGESLWGYMNGGADIYLEYGFDILRVEEFVYQDEEIKLEIFKMQDAVSAFGIYSVKTFKCAGQNIFGELDCLNKYQFQLAYGSYYIQLINNSGTGKAEEFMKKLATLITEKLETEELMLPASYLTDSLGLNISCIKMVKGYLGLQNKLIEMSSCFDGLTDYQVYFAKLEEDGETFNYYEIVFGDEEMKKRFNGNIQGKLPPAVFQNKNVIVLKTMQ